MLLMFTEPLVKSGKEMDDWEKASENYFINQCV